MPLFGKKSTRTLVQGADVAPTPSSTPSRAAKKSRQKREKKPKVPRASGNNSRKRIAGSRALLAVGCLLLAAAAVLLLHRHYRALNVTTTVVRLREDVAAGTELTRDMLAVTETGVLGLPDGVLRSLDEANGMVATSDLLAGEFLYRARIVAAEAYEGTTDDVKDLTDGMSLVTVEFPSTSAGIGGVLRGGDRVAVYEVAEREDRSGYEVRKRIYSLYVCDVLNSALESLDALDAKAAEKPDGNYDFRPACVVVRCTEEQAQILLQLEAEKSMHFAMQGGG